MLVPEVAEQIDEFLRAIAFGALVSARASFWLDEILGNLSGASTKISPKQNLFPSLVLIISRPLFYFWQGHIHNRGLFNCTHDFSNS